MPIPPYSIDVNGYDNTPEWGYCTVAGCEEAAFPIWLSGEYPDDPDLYLCPEHIGARILHEQTAREAWTELGARAEADAAAKLEALDCLLLFVERGHYLTDDDRALILRARTPVAGLALLSELACARAVVDACEGFAAFVEDYTPDSPLARMFPGFYADLRVHGKNARAAVEQAQKAREP